MSRLEGSDTRFLLKPDSDFFRFFGNPSGSVGGCSGEA